MKRCNCLSPVSTHRVPCSFCGSAAVQRSLLGNTVTACAVRVFVFSFAQDRL